MDKLFYRDKTQNCSISWNQFIEDLNKIDSFSSICYTTDFYEVFCLVTSALINEAELILVDGELKKEEVERLLIDYETNHLLAQKVENKFYKKLTINILIEQLNQAREAYFVLFTSGTTGKPKAVRQPIVNLKRGIVVNDKMKDAVWGFSYHPTHIAGLQVFLQALYNKNSLIRLYGLTPEEIEKETETNQITHISATPTFFRLFLSNEKPIKCVKRVTSGGEKMTNILAERLKRKFPLAQFKNIYASTEFGTLLISNGEGFEIPEKICNQVRIEGDELLVHRTLMGNFIGLNNEDEWYRTGDVVEVISEAPLLIKFLGRRNDMVNVGGMKVNINEVEEAISREIKVKYIRVYAKSNSVTGNILCCEIHPEDELFDETELRKRLSTRLQEYKIPRLFKLVKDAEVTRSMKTNRKTE